jgi:hypothetical protein
MADTAALRGPSFSCFGYAPICLGDSLQKSDGYTAKQHKIGRNQEQAWEVGVM